MLRPVGDRRCSGAAEQRMADKWGCPPSFCAANRRGLKPPGYTYEGR
jgi:hypothetical protein